MGCGPSNDVMPNDASSNTDKSELSGSPNSKTVSDYSVAFEVPFHDAETTETKRLPPKLQRLQEQQTPEPEETLKMLQKRLADADYRRQQILNMRVNSAQQFHLKTRTVT